MSDTIKTQEELLADAMAQIATMTQAMEALKLAKEASDKASVKTVKVKVSPKGTVHFRGLEGTHHTFGLGLYPKTLEWVLNNEAFLRKFLADNAPPAGFAWKEGCGYLSMSKVAAPE